ncbi:MAG: segregation/condensation protein A [Nanoarchaeota archaeon]
MQTKLLEIIFNKDEITWQALIYKFVKEEGMNPWDVNINLLSKKFFEMIESLKEMDFRISGKIILAAAILLRIKSKRLVFQDFDNLNKLIAMGEEEEDDLFFDELDENYVNDAENNQINNSDTYSLIPKTPLPRKRKVSVYELVDALQKALEVKKRRKNRINFEEEHNVKIPTKKKDMTIIIQEIYNEIKKYYINNKKDKISFSTLLPENSTAIEKVSTFIPLLYLDNLRRINLFQEQHLSEIEIHINKENINKEFIKKNIEQL